MTETKSKKRRVSKKTKKSWRKHVDTKDVDGFLEKARQDERLGSYSALKDSQLFVVDTEKQQLPKKLRRELLKAKEPHCLAMLKPHTSVPDPIAKRNRVRTKEERTNALVLRKERSRREKGILKLKERVRLANRRLAEQRRSARPKRGEFDADVWEKEEKEEAKDATKGLDTEWMTSDVVRHTVAHMGVRKRKVPSALRRKPSAAAAVEPPHPGTSYNPSWEDHQDLLRGVVEKEMEFLKEEAHLARVTTKMFKKVSPAENEKNMMAEMSEGLKPEQTQEEEDGDPTVRSVNPPVKNAKKTRSQKRKQREQREMERQRAQAKVEKKKISDIYRLRLLDRQLAAKERKEKILREKRLKKTAMKVLAPKTLSKVKFEPVDPAFKLSEELTGNLRASAPDGNLLKDRFKSLQQRNIIAPSTRKLKRDKAKVKRYLRSDHKIDFNQAMKERGKTLSISK